MVVSKCLDVLVAVPHGARYHLFDLHGERSATQRLLKVESLSQPWIQDQYQEFPADSGLVDPDFLLRLVGERKASSRVWLGMLFVEPQGCQSTPSRALLHLHTRVASLAPDWVTLVFFRKTGTVVSLRTLLAPEECLLPNHAIEWCEEIVFCTDHRVSFGRSKKLATGTI